MTSSGLFGYWREGTRLVMDRSAVLPDRCIKCNEPANGYRRSMNLVYVPRSQQLLHGAWSYLAAKRAKIDIGLCDRHRRSRAVTLALVSVAVIIASIIIFTQVGATDAVLPLLATAGLSAGVIGLLWAAVSGRQVRATNITDTHIWLRGAGEEFLASLPAAPPLAADGTLPTLSGASSAPDSANVAAAAFRGARTGALLFLVGCLVTAGTYLLLPGTFVIAWGLVVFGVIRLVGGLRAYVRLPAELRTMGQVLMLAGFVGVGAIASGWVGLSEVQASQFDSALTAATTPQGQAAALFDEIVNRPGDWTSQDAADMRKVASLYGQAADRLAASSAPARYLWYRDGLVRNWREAADIAMQLGGLTGASSQASFDALSARWDARLTDFDHLQTRLDIQQGRKAP